MLREIWGWAWPRLRGHRCLSCGVILPDDNTDGLCSEHCRAEWRDATLW